MKRIVMVALMLTCATISNADTYYHSLPVDNPVVFKAEPQNPDRYVSVGVSYAEHRLPGSDGGLFVAGRPIIVDVRIPITSGLTFTVLGGPDFIRGQRTRMVEGYTFGCSARLYLGQ